MSRRPVRLSIRLINSLPTRSTAPSHPFIGKVYISPRADMISCTLPYPGGMCRTEVRGLELAHFTGRPSSAVGGEAWIPKAWRDAMGRYAVQYPYSAGWTAPFLGLNKRQHCALLRRLGVDLAKSDDIGAKGIAHTIAAFSTIGKWRGR